MYFVHFLYYASLWACWESNPRQHPRIKIRVHHCLPSGSCPSATGQWLTLCLPLTPWSKQVFLSFFSVSRRSMVDSCSPLPLRSKQVLDDGYEKQDMVKWRDAEVFENVAASADGSELVVGVWVIFFCFVFRVERKGLRGETEGSESCSWDSGIFFVLRISFLFSDGSWCSVCPGSGGWRRATIVFLLCGVCMCALEQPPVLLLGAVGRRRKFALTVRLGFLIVGCFSMHGAASHLPPTVVVQTNQNAVCTMAFMHPTPGVRQSRGRTGFFRPPSPATRSFS